MHAFRSRFTVVTVAAATALAVGCNNDATGPRGQVGTGKALVLVTYGDPGVSIVHDTGATAGHVSFGDAFDGVQFYVMGDTVVSTSSKSGGDLFYLTDVGAGSLVTVPLPAGSNPSGASPIPANLVGNSGARFVVALRDSGAVALVRPPSRLSQQVTLLHGAGECPTDVFIAQSTIWAADANLNCRDFYQVLGPARLIGMVVDSARRDTLVLGDSAVGSAWTFAVSPSVAFVVTGGDFASIPGRVTRVSIPERLGAQGVTGALSLPAGYNVTSARVGHAGTLLVTASFGFQDYQPRVFEVDLSNLTFVGRKATGEQFLNLRDSTGALARCDAATEAGNGDIYCASNGGITSRLRVFSPSGTIVRSVATGGLAADVEVR